jgi:hypothetical protein
MALGRVGYRTLRDLLRHELSRREDPVTEMLIRRLRRIRDRGWFSRAEFLEMCRWKSPRALGHCRRNSSARIRDVSFAVLATRSERARIELLTRLHGVGVPMASAILTLIDPQRYGVLDIRVWQLLFKIKSVETNPRGRGFTVDHWDDYLARLRAHARALRVPVRAVEYTLFRSHRALQKGPLYEPGAHRPRRSLTPRRSRHSLPDATGRMKGRSRRTLTPGGHPATRSSDVPTGAVTEQVCPFGFTRRRQGVKR